MASRNRFLNNTEPGVGPEDDEAEGAERAEVPLELPLGLRPVPSPLSATSPVPAPPLPAEPEPLAEGGDHALAAPHTSAGDRLVRFAYRVGVPGATLARPFGRPAKLRLLATVESPLAGNRVTGVALRAGHFLVHGLKIPVAQMNFGPAARLALPVERVVHGFGWLRDLAACAPAPQCAATAERVLAAWLSANPEPASGAAWKVGHAAQRLLNWLVHAPLVLSGSDKALRTDTLDAIDETARWLDRAAGRADDQLDEVAAWCAVIAAGLLLPDGKPRRLHGEAGLVHALGELIGADGGVLSRSPLAQMEAIELLVELAACYRAIRSEPPAQIGAMLQMLAPPLLGVTHADGGLGSWQGSGAVAGERVEALLAAAGVRARPLGDARQWGYQRLAAGRTVLLFDAAPPPLARHARHGCASTLGFELSHGVHRLVVNCGGAVAAGGQIPARLEQGLRATAAHSTLVLGDSNSTAVLAGGKLGTGVSEVEVDRRRESAPGVAPASTIEASHNGYAARLGLIHRRTLALSDDGTQLAGEDLLVPSSRKARSGRVAYALRFHLGPGVEAEVEESGSIARLDLPDGSSWAFMVDSGTVELDESLWVDDEGVPQATRQLVVQGLVSRGGDSFGWGFERLGTGV
jgi:uncharacterized heparinase superfamily protein